MFAASVAHSKTHPFVLINNQRTQYQKYLITITGSNQQTHSQELHVFEISSNLNWRLLDEGILNEYSFINS